MYRSAVIMIGLGLAVAACHPPDQAIYDHATSCVGIFDVALKQVPPGEMRKAGLYSDDVDRTSVEAYEGVLQAGAKLRLTRQAISRDVDQAKKRAWQTYGASAGAKPSAKLLNAVRQCMPKPAGPND